MSILPTTDAEKAEAYEKLRTAVLAMFKPDQTDDERLRSAKRALMLAWGLDTDRIRAEHNRAIAELQDVLDQPHNADLRPRP